MDDDRVGLKERASKPVSPSNGYGSMARSSAVHPRSCSPGENYDEKSDAGSRQYTETSASPAVAVDTAGSETPREPSQQPEEHGQPVALTRLRKGIIFFVIGMNGLFVMICLSIMIPFFPTEAAEKDPNPNSVGGLTAIGFVFSITAFMEFLTAPFVGKALPTIGPKIVVALGGVLVSGTIAIFGFVDRIDDWTTFLVLCYALRAFQGVGTAFNLTASFALLFGIYPDSVSLVSGIMRAFIGLGLMVGPALSGFIYDDHGFTLPFLVYGGIMFTSAVAILFVLPGEVAAGEDKKSWDIILATIKYPWTILWLVISLVVGAAVGLLEPAISPYLREEFNVTAGEVGLIFLLHSAIFVILAPITGVIGDRWVKPKYIVVFGSLMQGLGLLFLGPVQVFGSITPALWKSILSMAIIGGGAGVVQTCTTPGMLEAMYDAGFTDSVELHGTVAGMITAFFSLGIAIGPTVGNAVTGAIGFPNASAIFSVVVLGTGFAALILSLIERFCKRCRGNTYDLEKTPLLKPTEGTASSGV